MKIQHPLRRAAAALLSLTLLLSAGSFTALANSGSCTLDVEPNSDITLAFNRAVREYSSVSIPAGEYTAGKLYINDLSNVSVEGNGAVIRSTTNTAGAENGILIRNSSGISVSNLTVVGAGGHGVMLDNSTGTFTNLTVRDSQRCGFDATGTRTVATVNNCQFLHNGLRPRESVPEADSWAAGMGVYLGASVTATDCTFSDNIASGVVLTTDAGISPHSNVTLYGALIQNNGDHGVGANPRSVVNLASSAARNCTITGNAAHGVMLMIGSSSSFIRNASILNNGDTGLDVGTDSTAELVENCTIVGNKSHGVLIYKNSAVKNIKNCTISGNGHHGIYVQPQASVSLSNTRVEGNAKEGLRLSGKKAKGTVSGGSLSGNRGCGVAVDNQAQLTLGGKVSLKKNKRYGFYATKSTKSTLKSVTCSENSSDGLRFTGDKCTATMDKCTVSGNKGNGIVLQSKASLTKLTKTKVTKNKKAGLSVYGKSSVGKTDGSSFTKNKTRQIYVQAGAKTNLKTK